ncbi:hypothetical protein A2Y85_03865 [candidate division WOR-3 bacterium RBG_13_43_14]|uniref:Asparaginase n=1 Tax=candidate division WOR-3 bacterium RBG_13_43_14 TaxID=1802590 RepID=A0A1F4U3Y5_UNCW3|nr:MAG: hypothetical protein A2Y85_03865 [candidate division WOR-3 bacterium RBG_13_43_14]
MKRIDCVIIANGGAGGIGFANRRRQGLIKAVRVGYAMLRAGSSSLDAVERAVMILEDTPIFNAGTGSCLNLKGRAEMDASITTSDLRFGAVAAIENIRNPIRVARLIMEKTDHLLLGGAEAYRFARIMGIKHFNPITKEARRTWRRRRRKLNPKYFPKLENLIVRYGTVGVVVIDQNGMIAVGTSTGGISLRLPGRIGDTPVIGGGFYANRYGGATATGHGEEIMRHLLSFRAVSFMARYSAPVAARKIIEYATNRGCRCGLVGIDRRGGILCVNNTQAMSWAYIKNGRLKVF